MYRFDRSSCLGPAQSRSCLPRSYSRVQHTRSVPRSSATQVPDLAPANNSAAASRRTCSSAQQSTAVRTLSLVQGRKEVPEHNGLVESSATELASPSASECSGNEGVRGSVRQPDASSAPATSAFNSDDTQTTPRRRRWRGRFANSASAGFLAAVDACENGDALEVIDDLLESQAARIHQIAAVNAFNERVAQGRLDAALRLVQVLDAANREDVIRKLSHAQFLRGAQQQAVQGNRDAAAAMEIARLHRERCRTFDEPLYGSLIYTCASARRLEEAAQLYGEFATQPRAHRQGQSAHAAMIAACSEATQALSTKDRRGRLVLLQRAMRVADDIRAAGQEPSLEVLHALAVAAGHAGQVQQALQICREMQAQGSVDVRMFTILVHAAATAGKRELALASYKRGLDSGAAGSVRLYTAAIGACGTPEQPVDIHAAMSIYNDMQQAGVTADCWLYAVMIRVAGRAGRLDIALQMQKDMAAAGISPTRETQSALLGACVANGALDEALAILDASQQSQQHMPLLPAFNALLAALARCSRLGDIITAVRAMREAQLQPDCFSFAAVLSACQRLQAYDLGAAVYGLLRRQGIHVDEAICFVVLRLCFNAQRAKWSPGGYPPSYPMAQDSWSKVATSTAASLLAALDPATPMAVHTAALADPLTGLPHEHGDQDEQGRWASMALGAYRDVLAAGCKPRLHVLERVLACLRLSLIEAKPPPQDLPLRIPSSTPVKVHATASATAAPPVQELQWPFDSRALAVVEGAIAQGVLPPPGQSSLDLRAMPPNLAQAYLLTHLAVLQRSFAIHGRQQALEVSVLVPPFDTMHVWRPSYMNGVQDGASLQQDETAETDELAHEFWDEYARRRMMSSQVYNSADFDVVHHEAALDPDDSGRMISMPVEHESHAHSNGMAASDGQLRSSNGWAGNHALAHEPALVQLSGPGTDFPGHCPLDERTGLGVAGLLRRIGLHGSIDSSVGRIVVKDSEVERWLRHAFGSQSSPAIYSPLSHSTQFLAPRRDMQLSIAEQQRRIRLGLAGC